MSVEFISSVPGPVWAMLGTLGAALFLAGGTFLGVWLSNRRSAKVDAGQLALEYAAALRVDLDLLKVQVGTLQAESNAYRSHAHVLHEWGGYVETPEKPRPLWPLSLPR